MITFKFKDAGRSGTLAPDDWVAAMQEDLDAGATLVTAGPQVNLGNISTGDIRRPAPAVLTLRRFGDGGFLSGK